MSKIAELINQPQLQLSLDDIISATNNFSEENRIGQGGFGAVYKGQLKAFDRAVFEGVQGPSKISPIHGTALASDIMVAVKRLDSKNGQGQNEFLKEIVMLASYQHDNIVTLVGFCDERDEKVLVYKYEDNGSLDYHLASTDLTWEQRLRICLGAARGLDYLHSSVGEGHRVIHRDIKSSNIVLDANWKAKISDFGLSKIGLQNENFTFLVTNPCGTFSYIDPVYRSTGILTKESDVYSFGIVLFEVLCRRLAMIAGYADERRFLSGLVERHVRDNNLTQIVSPNIQKQMNQMSYKTFTEIALRCLEEDRNQRPQMGIIVRELETALEHQIGRTKLWGSESGGDEFSFRLESNQKLKKITIYHGRWIHSLTFTAEDSNGSLQPSKKFGSRDYDPNNRADVFQIDFDADEEMIGISGTHGNHDGYELISSLCFVTTKKKYRTLGEEAYTGFSGSWDVGRFDGFYGRSGWYIDAIGCCLKAKI